MNIHSLSLEQLKEVISIKEQIQALEAKLSKLGSEVSVAPTPVTAAPQKTGKGRRKMSAEARAKIAAAATARWARFRGNKAAKAAPAAKAAVIKTASAPAPKKGRKKPVLSPEGRAKIVAALKARWAARRKG